MFALTMAILRQLAAGDRVGVHRTASDDAMQPRESRRLERRKRREDSPWIDIGGEA